MSSNPSTFHEHHRNEDFGHGPAFDTAADRGATVIAMPGVTTPDAAEAAREASRETRVWRDRVNGLNPEAAKLLLTDPMLIRLDVVQFGVVVRLHAMTRAGSPLTARVKVASKVLGLTPKRLSDTLLELQTLSPGLVREEAGVLVCDALVARPYVSHSDKRSAAAGARWDNKSGASSGATVASSPAGGAQVQGQTSASSSQPRAVGFRRLQQVPAPATQHAPSQASAQGVSTNADDAPEQAALWPDTEVPPAPVSKAEAAKRVPICPYDEIVALFNGTCVSLTRVRGHKEWTSTTRKTDVQRRWASQPTLEFWKSYFARVEACDRLTGRQDSPWRADFDWIMKPTHFDRIMDGVYDNRAGARRGLWNKGRAAAAPAAQMESDIDESVPFLQTGAGAKVEQA